MTNDETEPLVERYAAPRSIEEAVRLVAEGGATVLAGGTDLMPQVRAGTRDLGRALVNIRRIAGLDRIEFADGRFRVGALVTVTGVLESPDLAERARVLVDAADCFASNQIRNAATLGGNICNASPAGDMIVPLMLLDAEVELATWAEGGVRTRRLPLDGFFDGPGRTRRRSAEILTYIHFQAPGPDHVARFRKFGPRPALEIATVSVGIAGDRRGGALGNARVVFGAVAPTPLRGRRTEAAIEGRALDDATIAAACEAAETEVRPISDVRASAWYRRHLVGALTREILTDVADYGD